MEAPAAKPSKSSADPAKSATAPTPGGHGLGGRYVRVSRLPGKGIINLAEVQVFSDGSNIALKGKAAQSSVSWDGTAELAIDGNTNGDKTKGKSVMHTNGKARGTPWWQLDLGRETPLQKIVIWNRTDGDFDERSSTSPCRCSTAEKKVLWEKKSLPKPDPTLELAVGQ